MFARLRQLLQPPVFPDEETTRSAAILNTIILSIGAILGVVALLLYALQITEQANAGLVLGFLAFLVLLRLLLVRGLVRFATLALATAILAAEGASLYNFGTLRVLQALLVVIPIIITTILVGPRAGLAFYLAGCLELYIFYRREIAGLTGSMPTPSPLNQWVFMILFGYVILALLNLARRAQDETLARVRAGERTQEQTIRFLEATQGELSQRARALEATAELGRRLSTILNQDELIQAVTSLLQAEFGYSHVHFYLFDQDRKYLEVVGGSGAVGEALAQARDRVLVGEGLLGRATETRTTVLAPDVSLEPDWVPNPMLPETRAEIAAPIMAGRQVLGVLHIQHSEVGALNSNDADFISAAAAQAGVVIQNARLFAQIQRNAEQQVVLNTITQRIQGTNDVESAIKVAVRELGRAVNARQASVRLQMTGDELEEQA